MFLGLIRFKRNSFRWRGFSFWLLWQHVYQKFITNTIVLRCTLHKNPDFKCFVSSIMWNWHICTDGSYCLNHVLFRCNFWVFLIFLPTESKEKELKLHLCALIKFFFFCVITLTWVIFVIVPFSLFMVATTFLHT